MATAVNPIGSLAGTLDQYGNEIVDTAYSWFWDLADSQWVTKGMDVLDKIEGGAASAAVNKSLADGSNAGLNNIYGVGSKIGTAVSDAAVSSFDYAKKGAETIVDAVGSASDTASGIGNALANIGKTAETIQSVVYLAFAVLVIYVFSKWGNEIVQSVLEL